MNPWEFKSIKKVYRNNNFQVQPQTSRLKRSSTKKKFYSMDQFVKDRLTEWGFAHLIPAFAGMLSKTMETA